MVSTTHCSLRAASLKTVLTVGMAGRMYIPRTGEWGGAPNCPGLACGSTGDHVLSRTSSNILFPSLAEKLEESFSQAVPFFYLHRTKQIKHVMSLRRESLHTWTLEDVDIDLDPVSSVTSRAINLLGLHLHHLLEEENNRFALHTSPSLFIEIIPLHCIGLGWMLPVVIPHASISAHCTCSYELVCLAILYRQRTRTILFTAYH